MIRTADVDDLPTITALTSKKRRQLADWEREFWAMGENADEIHHAWLERLVASDRIVSRVALDGEEVVGFAVSLPREDGWIVDDVCVADHRWGDAGPVLLNGVVERPALTCVPHADGSQAEVFDSVGWTVVSHFRLLRLPGRSITPDGHVTRRRPSAFAPAAPSTFRLDLNDPDALVLVDHEDGHIVGSASSNAPGIYAPGGTTCVVDRIAGPRRDRLIAALTAAAAERGDVQVLVVCRANDEELRDILDDQGWRHPVDVFASPD